MTLSRLSLLLAAAVLAGCASAPPAQSGAGESSPAATFPATEQAEAYRLGLLHVQALRDGAYPLDKSAYQQGLRDALAGKTLASTTQADWQALARLSQAQTSAANLAAGRAFLERNKTQPGVVVLPSGVQYLVLKQGQGGKPEANDTVGISYTIAGTDGKVKVDTLTKGQAKMYEVALNKIVSKGWREALLLMPRDSKWRLFIPGELAFGDKGLSEKGILPNETLVIDTYLLAIKRAS